MVCGKGSRYEGSLVFHWFMWCQILVIGVINQHDLHKRNGTVASAWDLACDSSFPEAGSTREPVCSHAPHQQRTASLYTSQEHCNSLSEDQKERKYTQYTSEL